jgi:indolepyruvate ferredoxin oxidoreductase
VITVGALIAMAAHLEGKGATVLDFTGFAQKFGPVLSFLRIAERPEAINQVRIDQGAADALIGCDLVVSSSPKASATYRRAYRAVLNTAEMPTGDLVRFRDANLAAAERLRAIRSVTGGEKLATLDANALSERLFGDTVLANVIMLGFAWQSGLVPVSLEALERAIELNGVEVGKNRQALAAGRLACADPGALGSEARETAPEPETLDETIARRVDFLRDYQDQAWADRYVAAVERVRRAETGPKVLTEAVARALFKLMSYKDEYEVARLHMQTGFLAELDRVFEGPFKVNYHLAPPLLATGRDARGRPRKRQFGPWVRRPMRLLARMKRLRGTAFDVFGYTAERRMERELIGWYEGVVDRLVAQLGHGDTRRLVAIARAALEIRGYGPVKEASAVKAKAEVDRLLAETGADQPSEREAA